MSHWQDRIGRDVKLASFTSWLVGGPADYFFQPDSVEELKDALTWASHENRPVSIISGGTNVLISDRGVRGLVLCLGRLSGMATEEKDGRLLVTCLAGTAKSELLKVFLKYKLEPALFLAGLPGDIGAGVVMNAGVGEMIRPREFVEITDWLEVIKMASGSAISVRHLASDLRWSYRHCEGWRPGVVARVGVSWPLEPSVDVLSRVKAANHVRLSKQPLDMPSCGSVFVNPPGHKSGQLIESCGLKGFAIGGAQVSPKHANFIVNSGGATASDIQGVIDHVKTTVKARTKVDLHTEVVYLGEW